MDRIELLSNIIGLGGVSLVVYAYFQLQTHRWRADQMIFPLTNLLGAVCILFSLFFHWNLSSVVIELVWISISLYGLFHVFRKKRGALPPNFLPSCDQEVGGEEGQDGSKKIWFFDSYVQGMDFAKQVAIIAEQEECPLVISIERKQVTLFANEAFFKRLIKNRPF